MRIDVLALDDVFDLGLAAVLDAFQTANELIEMSRLAVGRFEVRTVGMRKAVKTSQGLRVPLHPVGTRPVRLRRGPGHWLQDARSTRDRACHADPIVQRFETWARARLTHGFSLDEAARAVRASKRTLARRMESVLGKSPLSYFQSLRVERAVHLLKTGGASVEKAAARVGTLQNGKWIDPDLPSH